MKDTIARMRDENDRIIEKLRESNEDELEELRQRLHENYLKDARKIHDQIPQIDNPEVAEQRENLDEI